MTAVTVISAHWFVFRGRGCGDYACGCGVEFMTPSALRQHVQAARAQACGSVIGSTRCQLPAGHYHHHHAQVGAHSVTWPKDES